MSTTTSSSPRAVASDSRSDGAARDVDVEQVDLAVARDQVAARDRRRARCCTCASRRRRTSSGVPPPTIQTPCLVASSRSIARTGRRRSSVSAIASLSPSPRPRNEKHSGSTTSWAPSAAAWAVSCAHGREVGREIVGRAHLDGADAKLPRHALGSTAELRATARVTRQNPLLCDLSRWYPSRSFNRFAVRWPFGHLFFASVLQSSDVPQSHSTNA